MTQRPPEYVEKVRPGFEKDAYIDYQKASEALLRAVTMNDTTALKEMASYGIDFNNTKLLNFNPLLKAVHRRSTSVIRTLLELGANPNDLSGPEPSDNPYIQAMHQGSTNLISIMEFNHPATPDVKVQMIKVAVAQGKMSHLKFMLDNNMYTNLERNEPELKKILENPLHRISPEIRTFIEMLYDKAPINPDGPTRFDAKKKQLRKSFLNRQRQVRETATRPMTIKRRPK